jgi:hypothetical protein
MRKHSADQNGCRVPYKFTLLFGTEFEMQIILKCYDHTGPHFPYFY